METAPAGIAEIMPPLDVIDKMSSPRVIKSHLPFHLLPSDLLDTCKVFYSIIRCHMRSTVFFSIFPKKWQLFSSPLFILFVFFVFFFVAYLNFMLFMFHVWAFGVRVIKLCNAGSRGFRYRPQWKTENLDK